MRSFKHISTENNIEKKENSVTLIEERYKPGTVMEIVGINKRGITLDHETFNQMIQDIQYLLGYCGCPKDAEPCPPNYTWGLGNAWAGTVSPGSFLDVRGEN